LFVSEISLNKHAFGGHVAAISGGEVVGGDNTMASLGQLAG